MLLRAQGLNKAYGGVVTTHDVGFKLRPGRVHALIEPNGAGKTTRLNILSGIVRTDSGRIEFTGRDITRARTSQVCTLGVGRTFQNLKLFSHMSVLDNVPMTLQEAASSLHQLTMAVDRNASTCNLAAQGSSEAADEVRKGGTLMSRVVETMQDISHSSKRIGEVIAVIDRIAEQTDIRSAAVTQGSDITTINEAVSAVDRGTQANAALVEESTAAAESLRVQAQNLSEAIEQFKLGEG